MNYKIYHNPRCSKSRQALEILHQNNIEPEIYLYKEKGLKKAELTRILKLLDKKPIDICRAGEPVFKEKNLNKNDFDRVIFEAILQNPELLERPIVIKENRFAALGRPPENISSLLDL